MVLLWVTAARIVLSAPRQLITYLDGGEGRHLQATALRIRRPLRVLRREPRQPLLLQRCRPLATERLWPLRRLRRQGCGHLLLLPQDAFPQPWELEECTCSTAGKSAHMQAAHPGS